MQVKILQFRSRTYEAKLFRVNYCSSKCFLVAGTLDGFIDLATPQGTWPITLVEAEELVTALKAAIADVKTNCLFDRDVLLNKGEER